MSLEEVINEFLNGNIDANKVEELINSNSDITNLDSIKFGKATRELNKKYREVSGEGIVINVNIPAIPHKKMVVALCKAIENKNSIENYI